MKNLQQVSRDAQKFYILLGVLLASAAFLVFEKFGVIGHSAEDRRTPALDMICYCPFYLVK
jgi:hypothetical protein